MNLDGIKDWKPLSNMEDISESDLADRVQKAYAIALPHQNITRVPYVGMATEVIYETSELVALCPVTLLPDFYKLALTIEPQSFVPELKGLKFYLMDYASLPISHEHLASRIARDLGSLLHPHSLHVLLDVNIRGGITTQVSVRYPG